jgi:hypothetical protein
MKIPKKFQMFLWMIRHDRVQTAEHLKKEELGWTCVIYASPVRKQNPGTITFFSNAQLLFYCGVDG